MKGHPHLWERRHINDVEELVDLGLSDRVIATVLTYYYAIEPPLTGHQVKKQRQRLGLASKAGKNMNISAHVLTSL